MTLREARQAAGDGVGGGRPRIFISHCAGQSLVDAPGPGDPPAIYRWTPGRVPQALPPAALRGPLCGHPEGPLRAEDGRRLASPDGGDIDNCKAAAPAARHFRLIRLD